MITCTRKIEFDAGHREMNHESKCRHLHGHRYKIEATFVADALDHVGRVVDFGEVKRLLGTWVDEHWDHTTVLHKDDSVLGDSISKGTGQTIFYMDTNPTAENMAEYLLKEVCPKLFAGRPLRCIHIRLHETPNCYADASE